jgi:micrococcal nuclease
MLKKLFICLSIVSALLLSPVNTKLPTASAYTETELDKKKIFKVERVVDGNTIKVNIRRNSKAVRLLGVDTPEIVDRRKPVQYFAKAASDKMKTFVEGKYVKLIDDSTQGNRDVYHRLLRYVYLPNSKATFVNGEIVKQGYAFSYKNTQPKC